MFSIVKVWHAAAGNCLVFSNRTRFIADQGKLDTQVDMAVTLSEKCDIKKSLNGLGMYQTQLLSISIGLFCHVLESNDADISTYDPTVD